MGNTSKVLHILNVSLDNEYIMLLIKSYLTQCSFTTSYSFNALKNRFKNLLFTIIFFYSLTYLDLSNQLDGGSWTELLTAKYFGASDPYNGRIDDGRWTNTEIPYMTTEFYEEEGVDPDHTFFPGEETEWCVYAYCLLS